MEKKLNDKESMTFLVHTYYLNIIGAIVLAFGLIYLFLGIFFFKETSM